MQRRYPHENLDKYKTAYSPLYKCFVSIVGVRRDDQGAALIDADMNGHKMVFRSYELERYTL